MKGPDPVPGALSRWFRAQARDLPWRRTRADGTRDPWVSLVSEVMLQQTQVSRVAERFEAFMERFPTPSAMASAAIDDVLSLWAGLGYYRRARSLHRAAVEIVARFGGEVPRSVDDLLTLPGVGRYTAGAVASMAYGDAAAIVDGNVVRVLLRVRGRPGAADDPATMRWAWEEAEGLVRTAVRGRLRPGVVNEAMMELGATVCTPSGPACGACPLSRWCVARREGTQGRIPRPKAAPAKRNAGIVCAVVRDARGRIAMEQRAGTGLWAGMWQPLSVEGAVPGWVSDLPVVARVVRVLSHRRVTFEVRAGRAAKGWKLPHRARWVAPEALAELAVSSAHRAVLRAVGA